MEATEHVSQQRSHISMVIIREKGDEGGSVNFHVSPGFPDLDGMIWSRPDVVS